MHSSTFVATLPLVLLSEQDYELKQLPTLVAHLQTLSYRKCFQSVPASI